MNDNSMACAMRRTIKRAVTDYAEIRDYPCGDCSTLLGDCAAPKEDAPACFGIIVPDAAKALYDIAGDIECRVIEGKTPVSMVHVPTALFDGRVEEDLDDGRTCIYWPEIAMNAPDDDAEAIIREIIDDAMRTYARSSISHELRDLSRENHLAHLEDADALPRFGISTTNVPLTLHRIAQIATSLLPRYAAFYGADMVTADMIDDVVFGEWRAYVMDAAARVIGWPPLNAATHGDKTDTESEEARHAD